MDFEMTAQQPAPAERVAVLKDGGQTFRAAWRIVGDIEGGTLVLEPRGILAGWSLEQVRSVIWAAILRGCITLAGVPARVRRAVRSGTLCIGRLLRTEKTMKQHDETPPPAPGTRYHPLGAGRPRTDRRLARTRWARLDDAARVRLLGPGQGFKAFWVSMQAGVWGGL